MAAKSKSELKLIISLRSDRGSVTRSASNLSGCCGHRHRGPSRSLISLAFRERKCHYHGRISVELPEKAVPADCGHITNHGSSPNRLCPGKKSAPVMVFFALQGHN